MAVMIIDAINISLRFFVLLFVVEFGFLLYEFVLLFVRLMSSGNVHFRLSVMMAGHADRRADRQPLPVVGVDGM